MNFKKTSARASVLGTAVLFACAWAGQAAAAVAVTPGCQAADPANGSVLFTNFSQTNGSAPGMHVASSLSGSHSTPYTWGSTSGASITRMVEFSNNGSTYTAKAGSTSTAPVARTSGPLNFVRISVEKPTDTGGRTPKTYTTEFNNVFVGATPVGNFVPGSNTCWTITGVDFAAGDKITGQIKLQGDFPGQNSGVQISVGYIAPTVRDADAPVVTDVTVSPDPVILNGTARVAAVVDDSATGGSDIASAEYSLNGAAWAALSPIDAALDSSLEGVQATFPATKLGDNEVCVRGTDSAGNQSKALCQTFTVIYRFEGFFSPIDNDLMNSARAGQGIPAKWRLTDANGTPIDDRASFVGLYSMANACTSTVVDAVEEEAAGDSGLQYLGDGYWQFNWKTPKDYAGTCRSMYVKLKGGQTSPVVKFQFRR